MRLEIKTACVAALGTFLLATAATGAKAEEARCTLHDGKKVVCPVHSDADLQAAEDAYGKEAETMAVGTAGSTYGVAPFDRLTGVGKAYDNKDKKSDIKNVSGYGNTSGKTELWDRVRKPAAGETIYNQWTHNWSPTFKTTLVPGADPNEGKQWYYVYCIACHGWGLQGDGPNALAIEPRPRILTKGDYMNKKSNLQLFTAIKGGGEAVGLSPSMPNWGNIMQDQDIWNVVAFLRAMADVGTPKSIDEYLNPKSSFKPIAGDVDALNASKSNAFQDAQELLEAGGVIAGRADEGALTGGGYVEGGLRKTADQVNEKVKKGY